jgi:hypothetical protein
MSSSAIPAAFAGKTLRLWIENHPEPVVGTIVDANEVVEDILLTIVTNDERTLRVHQSKIGSWEVVQQSA